LDVGQIKAEEMNDKDNDRVEEEEQTQQPQLQDDPDVVKPEQESFLLLNYSEEGRDEVVFHLQTN
jgi:hypothetical protein